MSAPTFAPTNLFASALDVVLWNEGVRGSGDTGWVHNPADPGGPTNWGITLEAFRRHRRNPAASVQELRELVRPEVDLIYKKDFWIPGGAFDVALHERPFLALVVFDWSVNAGVFRGRTYAQASVGAEPDGIFGPKTRVALSRTPERDAISRYLHFRAAHYHIRGCGPLQSQMTQVLLRAGIRAPKPDGDSRQFLNGWLARLRYLAKLTGVPVGAGFAVGAEHP